MKSRRRFDALGAIVVLSLGLFGLSCGSSNKDSGPAQGVKTVPRPPSSDGAVNEILDDCSPDDPCTGAASCQATCGLHELGDRGCMCGGTGTLTCADCSLNSTFLGMIQDAVELCPAGVNDGASCAVKGSTCIRADRRGREGCLCWMGRTRLEYDCSQSLNGFFRDMAPPTPDAGPVPSNPRGDGGGGVTTPALDAAAPAVDAAAAAADTSAPTVDAI